MPYFLTEAKPNVKVFFQFLLHNPFDIQITKAYAIICFCQKPRQIYKTDSKKKMTSKKVPQAQLIH
jgi:hypothetical protein